MTSRTTGKDSEGTSLTNATTKQTKYVYKILPDPPPTTTTTTTSSLLSSSSSSSPPQKTEGNAEHHHHHLLPQTLPLSSLDQSSGFIHLCTASQTATTAARFFADHTKLWILRVATDRFDDDETGTDTEQQPQTTATITPSTNKKVKGNLIWEVVPEVTDSENVFPHLYDGDLGRDVVVDIIPVVKNEGNGKREGEEKGEGERWEDVFERVKLDG